MAAAEGGGLLGVIADEETVTGFLLAGVGDVSGAVGGRNRKNFLTVTTSTSRRRDEHSERGRAVRAARGGGHRPRGSRAAAGRVRERAWERGQAAGWAGLGWAPLAGGRGRNHLRLEY